MWRVLLQGKPIHQLGAIPQLDFSRASLVRPDSGSDILLTLCKPVWVHCSELIRARSDSYRPIYKQDCIIPPVNQSPQCLFSIFSLSSCSTSILACQRQILQSSRSFTDSPRRPMYTKIKFSISGTNIA